MFNLSNNTLKVLTFMAILIGAIIESHKPENITVVDEPDENIKPKGTI